MSTFDEQSETTAVLARLRAIFAGTGPLDTFAILYCDREAATPRQVMMAMPGMDDVAARYQVQRRADEDGGYFVAVTHEAWFTTHPPGPEADRATAAAARGELHLLPDRREKMIVDVEGETMPIRRFYAEITRDGDVPTLGPWEEQTLSLPRPGFKRYLVEQLPDGKRLSATGIVLRRAP